MFSARVWRLIYKSSDDKDKSLCSEWYRISLSLNYLWKHLTFVDCLRADHDISPLPTNRQIFLIDAFMVHKTIAGIVHAFSSVLLIICLKTSINQFFNQLMNGSNVDFDRRPDTRSLAVAKRGPSALVSSPTTISYAPITCQATFSTQA